MLASISSAQFTEWMGFFAAEMEIREEANQKAMLEAEALRGAAEIRNKVNASS